MENNLINITDLEIESFNLALKIKFGIDFTLYNNSRLRRCFNRFFVKLEIESLYELWAMILKNNKLVNQLLQMALIIS